MLSNQILMLLILMPYKAHRALRTWIHVSQNSPPECLLDSAALCQLLRRDGRVSTKHCAVDKNYIQFFHLEPIISSPLCSAHTGYIINSAGDNAEEETQPKQCSPKVELVLHSNSGICSSQQSGYSLLSSGERRHGGNVTLNVPAHRTWQNDSEFSNVPTVCWQWRQMSVILKNVMQNGCIHLCLCASCHQGITTW